VIVNLSFELHQDYVEEIMNALGIVEDEYKEIVEGKRADKQFTCDIYDAADVISEYISNYCEQGLSVADAVNKLLSSEEGKDCLFNLFCEVKSSEL